MLQKKQLNLAKTIKINTRASVFQHKPRLALTAVVCALALAGCQPKSKPEDTAASDQQNAASAVQAKALQLEGNVAPMKVTLADCSGNNCPHFEVERLQSNFEFIDRTIDQAILNNLKQILEISQLNDNEQASSAAQPNSQLKQLDGAATSSVTASETDQMQQQVQVFADSFSELDQELKTLSGNHQISVMIKPSIIQSNPPVATVVLNTSSYLGGAHGSSAQQYYNFDLKREKQISLNDLLVQNQRKALENKAHDAFKNWVIQSGLATKVEEYEQAWKFKLSDNFLLAKQGLILQYSEYEIGPYSSGLPRLVIPYDQLQGIIKSEYLPKPTQAASEPAVQPDTAH